MEDQSGGSPLPSSVMSPRMVSPAKSRSSRATANASTQDEPGVIFVTPQTEAQSQDGRGSIKPDDGSFMDVENSVFLTEAATELADIQEEEDSEFDSEPIKDPDDDLDDFDGDSRRSPDSQVSSMSDEDDDDGDYDTDLEVEPEKWLHPELFDRDTTGKNRYLRTCDDLNIQPITYFVKHMQDTELVMKYHGLGPLGVRAMSDPLEVRLDNEEMNTTIEKMDLEGNYILGVGATYLSRVLKDNVYVTELCLSENKIGNDGARSVCDLLMENKTITHVDLKGNEIEDSVAECFHEMLSKNTDLKTLVLRNNRFEDAGARWFKDAIADNDTLETLDLSWNHFQWRGCVALAEGVQENAGIKYLDLCMNGFGRRGAEALEEALRSNHTLRELNISYCRIPMEGAPYVAAGLQHNDCLRTLNVGYNPLQSEGGFCILVAAERNDEEHINYLDFGNLMVKKDFKIVAEQLAEERNMTVLYGGVIPDVPRFRNANWDPLSALVHDPMTKLKAWLDQAGKSLVDLLLTFDRDMSLSLDVEELKLGIRSAQIDLTDTEIEILMKNLDADGSGSIDFSELMEGEKENMQKQEEAERFKEELDEQAKARRKSIKVGDASEFKKIIQDADSA